MSVSIRNADTADIPVIRVLAEDTWWPTYTPLLKDEQVRYMLDLIYSVEALTTVMTQGTQQFILLSDDQGPQGFAAYGARTDEPVYKLHKLYVRPGNQGKGYGRMLLHEVVQRVKDQGITTLDLNVNRYNPAKSFYEKAGFSILREEDIAIGPYWMNDYVMRRIVTP
ncbi:GNAT family N-acetyltransferase [Parachryseolinea silvisoli]|jgi:GNAT superfamily N-acetyltransferase|uniref:GNAT family N-acetyltransferase n=1 Tax=Parachryseolinea silvisoli TaxID=2873601 RepID=UPI0022658619|nr:GNAT family N-acetyltransferase [Parachryseolinea silvisoli]MCD9017802.1 GNAT family N-acetyltransferase [Parachryseolinea silvisoli]